MNQLTNMPTTTPSEDEMDEAIARYEQARDDGTLDEKYPVIGKSTPPETKDMVRD